MDSAECCGHKYAVSKGQWVNCPKCGASITHTTLKAKTEPVTKSPAAMAGSKPARDGTERLCQAVYGRPAEPRDYIGGSNAQMLYDAADLIKTLEQWAKA